MLRITTEENDSVTRFRLEGKLVGDWVRELERCWIRFKHDGRTRRFAVNLNSVSFIDAKGAALLEAMVHEHVELEANNPFMQSTVQRIVEHAHATQA